MPSFLIKQPRCVFIHNPKTGGQALRKVLLQGEFEGPLAGRLPDEWTRHFVFTFVRNPFDRLISAWKMFTEGIEDTGWKVPLDLQQGMSLADFLEVVTDESIGYGPGKRTGRIRVRNHTLPQTHDYYSLEQADYIGRFENYEIDVNRIFQRLGIDEAPPGPWHVTNRGPYRQYFDDATRLTAENYYAGDLERFEYQF